MRHFKLWFWFTAMGVCMWAAKIAYKVMGALYYAVGMCMNHHHALHTGRAYRNVRNIEPLELQPHKLYKWN